MGPREEIPEIPTDAVREILINAYTHRDWLSSGCVQIDIYNDSVEVFNPGWFIEGQDPEAHLSGKSRSSLTRNELIARTLYRSKDIESYASGIPRVRDLCANANIRIEYQRMADGTNFVFHRNDAFADKPPTNRRQTAEPLESQPPLGGICPRTIGSCTSTYWKMAVHAPLTLHAPLRSHPARCAMSCVA